MPDLIIHLKPTPATEWSGVDLRTAIQKASCVLKESGLQIQTLSKIHSRFKIVNIIGGDLHDHLKRKRISTLKMIKIFN